MATLHQLDALSQRTLDLCFIRPPDGILPDGFDSTVLRVDPLLLVLPDTHRLAALDVVPVSALAGLPFVMYPANAGVGIYGLIFRLCRAAGFVPHIAQEAGEASTIIGLVAAGCGISLLPSSFDRIRMNGVVYRPLTDPDAITELVLVQRSGETAALVDAFTALARALPAEAEAGTPATATALPALL